MIDSEPMRELLQTERVYIEDLRRCITVYVDTFDKMEKDGKVSGMNEYLTLIRTY